MGASKEKVEARRRQVFEMLMQGIPESAMAKSFGVHRNTIVNDVREIRKKHRSSVADGDAMEEIGEAAAKLEEMFQYAMQEYATSENKGAKRGFLSEAREALMSKVRMLVEVGVLPKAAQEITGKLVVQGVDLDRASVEELRALRDRMVAQMPPDVLKRALNRMEN